MKEVIYMCRSGVIVCVAEDCSGCITAEGKEKYGDDREIEVKGD